MSRLFVESMSFLQTRNVIRQIRMTTINILNFILDVRRDYRIALALAAFRQQYEAIEAPNNNHGTENNDEHVHSVGWPETYFEQVARDVAAEVRKKTERDTRLHLDGHASTFKLCSACENRSLTQQMAAIFCASCFSSQCPNLAHCRHLR